MADVTVTVARAEERRVIANMMQFYIHDFSEQWAGQPRGELGEDGLFADYPLDPYWRDADHIPLLVRADGHLAGFALINASSHSGLPLDRNVAEFFIARKHRRGGVGTVAARTIFSRWPGQWEAAVARRNVGALPFWRSAAAHHPDVGEIEELDLDTPEWNGPIVRFTIRAPA
jgi:predicted acetyltransferase